MHQKPGFCEIITLVHISQQHRFGFLKNNSEHMLVTSENFKTYFVFSDCIQGKLLYIESVPVSSIMIPSHVLSKLQPDKPSHHLLNILSVFVPPNLCSSLTLASSIFPLTFFTYPNSVSSNFRWTGILLKCQCPQLQGLSSLNSLSTFFPPHHTLYVLIEDLITSLDHPVHSLA